MNTTELIPIEAISQRIFIIRGVKVMLDADLAELYGVPTKSLNLAVKRNMKRFPSDFVFRLTEEESKNLRFQFETSSSDKTERNRFQFETGSEEYEAMNPSQIVTGSDEPKENAKNLRFQNGTSSWGGQRYAPYAFTEHGVAMLSAVLRSERAVEMSVYIVRAFIKLRELLASNKDLGNKVEEIEREQKTQNKHINAIYRILDKLIDEPVKKEGKMGFNQ